jgi:ABC transporter substrate binding protein
VGLRDEAKPLGVEQVATSPVPVGQAGAKLCDPLRLPTEADEGSAPAYGRLREPLRQGMLVGEIDGRLGSLSRRIELVPEVMQNRGKVQSEDETVSMREASSEVEARFDPLQGLIGEAEEPKSPCRVQPAHDTGALRVEQEVVRIFPGRDRIIDRDPLAQLASCIGKSAEQEQRCTSSAPGQGAAERCALFLPEHDQALGQIKDPLEFAPHNIVVPQSPQHWKHNVTGFALMDETTPKLLEFIRQIKPEAKQVAYLFDPSGIPEDVRARKAAENASAAASLELRYRELPVRSLVEIEAAIPEAKAQGADALVVEGSTILLTNRFVVTRLIVQSALPAIYRDRQFAVAEGLISYGEDLLDLQRRAVVYVDRLLRGTRVSDLPVQQASTFELVVNLRTAKVLGLAIPPAILARADEIIE